MVDRRVTAWLVTVVDRRSRAWLVAAGVAVTLAASMIVVAVNVSTGAAASRLRAGPIWCVPTPGFTPASGPGVPSGSAHDSRCDATRSPGGPKTPTLRSIATPRGIRVGSAVNADALANDRRYADVLRTEFSSVTPEDAMKWRNVEPVEGTYNWSQADRIVDFAKRNDQQVYGHTLVWHSSLPDWLSTDTLKPAQIKQLLHRRIVDQVTRYRGAVWAWDVVNEAIDTDGDLRDSIWLRALGPDYIEQAFRWVKEVDPLARLFLNDYGIEGVNAKSNALYRLVQQLRAKGVPVDGVGFQTHWTTAPLPLDFTSNLRRFANLGVDVAITEADVRVVRPAMEASLTAQATVYRQIVEACLAVSRCVSFSVWGFSDKYSWVPSLHPDAGDACLFTADYRAKQAYSAVADAFRKGAVRTSESPHSRRAG